MSGIAGVELGGTKCVVALGNRAGQLAERVTVPTADPETTLAAIEAVLGRWPFDALGIASFGPIDLTPGAPDYGTIAGTTKPGWDGTPVFARLRERFGVPTAIHTDVIGAALAEGRWGAAQGLADHVYITIGTGVGVGAIVNGRPAGGMLHGEAGHMRITRAPGDSFPGACVFHGDCVEGLVSGPALAVRTGMATSDIPDDHPVWAPVTHDIAMLLHDLVVTLAPERIAIGGGVPGRRPGLLPMIRAALAQSLAGYGQFGRYVAHLDTRIGPPGLSDDAGPLGAIALGIDALEGKRP